MLRLFFFAVGTRLGRGRRLAAVTFLSAWLRLVSGGEFGVKVSQFPSDRGPFPETPRAASALGFPAGLVLHAMEFFPLLPATFAPLNFATFHCIFT